MSTQRIPVFTHLLTCKSSDPEMHSTNLYWNDTAESSGGERRKERHPARSTEMLALSLAHDSVNSLLGPLAQRGVQGCKEINQQLTSSHHFRSCFNSQKTRRDTNNPLQTLFYPEGGNTQKKMKKLKMGQSRLYQTWQISRLLVCSGIYQVVRLHFTAQYETYLSQTSKQTERIKKEARWDL